MVNIDFFKNEIGYVNVPVAVAVVVVPTAVARRPNEDGALAVPACRETNNNNNKF